MIDHLGTFYICTTCYNDLKNGMCTVEKYNLPTSYGSLKGRIVLRQDLNDEIVDLNICPLCAKSSLVKHAVSLDLWSASTVSPDLDDYKQWAIDLIEKTIEERISHGFEYPPGSGHIFGLKTRGAINWLGLLVTASAQDYVSAPPKVDSEDGTFTLVMNSANEVTTVVLLAMYTVKQHLDAGGNAQREIRSNTATTVEQVDAILNQYL